MYSHIKVLGYCSVNHSEEKYFSLSSFKFHGWLLASYSERFVMSAFLKEDLHLLIWATYQCHIQYDVEYTVGIHWARMWFFRLSSPFPLQVYFINAASRNLLVIVLGSVALKYRQPIFYMLASNFMLLSCSKITKACLFKLDKYSSRVWARSYS